jgi:hypothetical protein
MLSLQPPFADFYVYSMLNCTSLFHPQTMNTAAPLPTASWEVLLDEADGSSEIED